MSSKISDRTRDEMNGGGMRDRIDRMIWRSGDRPSLDTLNREKRYLRLGIGLCVAVIVMIVILFGR